MRGDTFDLPLEAKLAVYEGNVVKLVEGECGREHGMLGEEMGEMGADAAGVLVGVSWGGASRTRGWTARTCCWTGGEGREFSTGWTCRFELGRIL